MEKTDVLVIGGTSGMVAAITGKSNYPEKDFLLIRQEQQMVVPCGIPYIFGSLENSEKDIMGDAGLNKAGIPIKVDEVVSLDRKKKVCRTKDGTEIGFDKLVLATGSLPVVPGWLQGTDLENVFTIPKNKVYLDAMLTKLRDCQNVVVIGGGFIGVEVSDELHKRDKHVTLVEILPHILGLVFNEDIARQAEDLLQARGIGIETGSGVKEIVGEGKVSSVLLNNGKRLEADAVILAMGYRPNAKLAAESGLEINGKNFIRVDEYMRTDNPDIFAVGDCAEKRDFITRKLSNVMLASTACAEARIAGMNLYKLSALKTFNGTISIFSTAIGDTAFGVAGLTEKTAKQEGFHVVTGTFEGIDKHPGTLPNTHKQFVKLIAAGECGTILGGSVVGGSSAGELTNLIGVIIQNRMTVNAILTAQIGTHPLLTGPPTVYPLIKAAEAVARNMRRGRE